MKIYLTQSEQSRLDELCDKKECEWARFFWSVTIPSTTPTHFEVHIADAYVWKDIVDSSRKGFLPHASGDLRQKLQAFYDSIT